MGKNMEKVNFSGLITQYMLDNSLIIIFMDMEFILGLIRENTKANGKIIRCKVKENLHGLMDDYIMEII